MGEPAPCLNLHLQGAIARGHQRASAHGAFVANFSISRVGSIDPNTPCELRKQPSGGAARKRRGQRSEERTTELQSLMRNSYAVFSLKTNINRSAYKHTQRPPEKT